VLVVLLSVFVVLSAFALWAYLQDEPQTQVRVIEVEAVPEAPPPTPAPEPEPTTEAPGEASAAVEGEGTGETTAMDITGGLAGEEKAGRSSDAKPEPRGRVGRAIRRGGSKPVAAAGNKQSADKPKPGPPKEPVEIDDDVSAFLKKPAKEEEKDKPAPPKPPKPSPGDLDLPNPYLNR
jgi:hypothetical protein